MKLNNIHGILAKLQLYSKFKENFYKDMNQFSKLSKKKDQKKKLRKKNNNKDKIKITIMQVLDNSEKLMILMNQLLYKKNLPQLTKKEK